MQELVIFGFGAIVGVICYFLHQYKSPQSTTKDTATISNLTAENEKLKQQLEEVRTELTAIVMAPVTEPVAPAIQTLNIAYPDTKRKFDFTVIPGYKYAFLPREIQEAAKRFKNLKL